MKEKYCKKLLKLNVGECPPTHPILKTFKLDLKNLPTQFQNFNAVAVVWPSIGQQGRRQ